MRAAAITDSVLADCVEALIGAIFLDGGYPAARRAVVQAFGPLLDAVDPKVEKDAKTRLQELMHARGKPAPQYRVIATHGAPHERSFEVECIVEDARAEGRSSRGAPSRTLRRRCSKNCNERAPLRNDRHCRAPEHRQVEPAEPPRGREGLDRLPSRRPRATWSPASSRGPTASTSSSMRRDAKAGREAPAPRLNRRATEAARDADVALFVVEALRFGPEDRAVLDEIPAAQRMVAAVNKVDLVKHASAHTVPRSPGRRRATSPPSCR